MSAVELNAVSKAYSQAWRRERVLAVDQLSLTVEEGEAFGFIGANGAGKSTTIKMITGALKPSGGSGRVFGRALGDPEARKGVSYVPENPSLPELLTPVEVLGMALRLHGVKVPCARTLCLKWLERFALDHVADKLIRGFSKGMVQRTALAHAMVISPRMLVLDEPLSGLDPIGRKDVVDILEEYRRAGGTIFFSSHVLHDVERIADRFGLIHRGQLKTIAAPGDLLAAEEMLTVRSMGLEAVGNMHEETSGRWSCDVTRGDLWRRLRELEEGRHQLIEIKPRLSLEAAFLHYVRQEN